MANPDRLVQTNIAVTEWMRSRGWAAVSVHLQEDPDGAFYVWQDDPPSGRAHALWISQSMVERLAPDQLLRVLNSEGVAEDVRISVRVRIEERGNEFRVSPVPRRSGETPRQD